MFFFILGFCILLRVLYQGYWKNRPSQQLFLRCLFRRYMFRPLLAIFRRNTQLFSGTCLTTTDPLFCVIGLILYTVWQILSSSI
jgi:hypothetical protein